MDKIRLGIIGYGVQGSLYAKLLLSNNEKVKDLILTCVSSRSEEAMKDLPENITIFTDYKKLIASDLCDAIIITVPHFLHPAITIEALKHHKHVLCEKPAGIYADEVRAMKEEQEKTSLTLAMMFNNRANPLFQKCHELIDSGTLGNLRHMTWIINNFYRPDTYYAFNAWRGTWDKEGGGILVNQIAHQLDLLLWLCGEPQSISAVTREARFRDIEVENEVSVDLSFKNGASGILYASTYDPFGINRLELDFSKGKILIEDNETMKVLRYKEDESTWNKQLSSKDFYMMKRSHPDSLFEEETFFMKADSMSHYFSVFENFALHILHGETLIADIEDGLKEVQLANAIYESAWAQKKVLFPGDEEDFRNGLIRRFAKK